MGCLNSIYPWKEHPAFSQHFLMDRISYFASYAKQLLYWSQRDPLEWGWNNFGRRKKWTTARMCSKLQKWFRYTRFCTTLLTWYFFVCLKPPLSVWVLISFLLPGGREQSLWCSKSNFIIISLSFLTSRNFVIRYFPDLELNCCRY